MMGRKGRQDKSVGARQDESVRARQDERRGLSFLTGEKTRQLC